MIPVAKKTYSRKANQTTSSESSFSFSKHSNDESEKENKGNAARQSKNKAVRKIRKDVLEGSFEANIDGPADKTEELFEKLLSSPPKVEVNYKPLSFWAEKVQGLEAKNPVKKKCQLYELSDSDELCSPELRKKKVKRKPGVRKKKAAASGFNIDYNKFYRKKLNEQDTKSKSNKTNEGIIIKERLLLKKEKEKLANKEDKFTFEKDSSLMGITSTPGRDKINIVGASNFSFYSPIQESGATPNFKPPDFDVSSIKNEEQVEEENKTVVQATPVVRKSSRLRTKRVSEEDNSNFSRTLKNGSVENFSNPFLGFDSGDLNHSVKKNGTSVCSRRFDCENEAVCKDLSNHEHFKQDIVDPGGTSWLKSHSSANNLEVPIISFIFEHSEKNSFHSDKEYASESDEKSFKSHSSENKTEVPKNSFISEHSQQNNFHSDKENVSESDVESFKSAESHCSVSEPEELNRNWKEIGKKVVLLLQLNFASQFKYRLYFITKCKNSKIAKMKMWSSLENICENDHPCYYSDNEDDNGEFVFNCESDFQSSEVHISENENEINNESIENSICKNEEREGHETTSVDQSFENSFRNVTIRRRYDTVSRIQSTREKSSSQSESSNEISNLYKTAVDIEKLEETLQRLSVNPLEDQSQESSQYSSKVSVNQSINDHKFNKTGNDSSIFESSPEVNNKTVRNIDSYKEDTVENPNQGKLEVQNEEATKYLSPELDTSIYTRNKLTLTPTSSKFLSVDDTLASPLPIFESTVCEPAKEMLESTARLSVFQNHRNSHKLQRKTVRSSDWNITKISDCAGDDVMPPPLDSSVRPDVMGETLNFSVNLKSGKKWGRSMSILRQIQSGCILENEDDGSYTKGRNYKSFVKEVLEMQPAAFHESVLHDGDVSKTMGNLTTQMSNISISARRSMKVVPANNSSPVRESLFRTVLGLVEEEDETDCESKDATIIENTTLKELKKSITARDVVLTRCNQEEPVLFEEFFNERTLKNCKKIGEGVYGEVFLYNSDTVIKIIPIEGSEMVNGDRQKKFEEILSEIVIAMELSNLRYGTENRTSGFNELKRCWCVVGEYPQYLIDLWEEFDRTGNGSENDHPGMFKSDQLYIVLELANGGKDLEAFVFNSAEQSLSVFVQTAYILAVAEKALEFEHRDLHWGNLLISNTDEKTSTFALEGIEHIVPLKGVKVSIIDFTLSRMTYEGCCIFNDLSIDPELFTSQGDYQFEIYRLMQNEVKNNWSLFRPKTNVFWLHYILDKMISLVRYRKTVTKVHKTNIKKLKDLKASMLEYVNSSDFVVNEIPY